MRATANPHERPVSGIQIDALNGENGTRCGQTASRWANGRFWWKLLFEAKPGNDAYWSRAAAD